MNEECFLSSALWVYLPESVELQSLFHAMCFIRLNFSDEGGEILVRCALRSCRFPVPGNIQEQPDLVEDVHVH